MKIKINIKKKILSLTFLLVGLVVFFFQSNSQLLNALPMNKYQSDNQ